MYHGDIRLGDSIDVKFCTVTTTGVPTTLAGSPVVSAYPGNSTTELTAGITLTVDFDSRTGLNNVRVVASGGNGYATATNYMLVITTGTVGGTSVVGYCIGSFSIEARSALMPATPGRTAVVDASGLMDANAVKLGPTGAGAAQSARDIGANVLLSSGTGAGQVKLSSGYVAPNWGDVGNPTTTNNLSGTTVKTATDIATATTSIQADTDDIQTRLPAALVSGRMDASVGALAAGIVTSIQSGLATAANQTTSLANEAAIAGYIDTEVAAILTAANAIKLKTDLIPGTIDGKTFAELVTLFAAVLLGKASGLEGTAAVYRAVNDSKDRVTATVDSHGNRTAVTLDAT